MMEKCVLEIKTGMYAEPFFAEGSYSDEKGIRKYTWTEKHPNEKIASDFELFCDAKGKQVTVIRGGDVTSKMVFEPGNRTKGSLNTMFGVIEVVIETDYVNFPSALNETLEFSYTMDPDEGESVKNVFSIKRLLQNSEG
ncbi:MAG: DUF1934 domain-containing protein [Ruminococcaceae bacterium]|nr:DUF1934 domain-containing protein [Oscillospiraceae bacterium]